MPGARPDGAVAGVTDRDLIVGAAVGAGVGALGAPPVAARASFAPARTTLGRLGVENAVVADADHYLGARVAQPVGQAGGVVAGIEDEDGHGAVGGQ